MDSRQDSNTEQSSSSTHAQRPDSSEGRQGLSRSAYRFLHQPPKSVTNVDKPTLGAHCQKHALVRNNGCDTRYLLKKRQRYPKPRSSDEARPVQSLPRIIRLPLKSSSASHRTPRELSRATKTKAQLQSRSHLEPVEQSCHTVRHPLTGQISKSRHTRFLLDVCMPTLLGASNEDSEHDLHRMKCEESMLSTADSLVHLSQHKKNCWQPRAVLDPLSGAKLTQAHIISGKPEKPTKPEVKKSLEKPLGHPRVWADTRQELCESLPYFRSYQSGIYFHNNVVLGYLLDGFGSTRDYIGCRVVISHGGGKSSMVLGEHALVQDQTMHDKSVAALINNYKHQIPVVLILGSKCLIAPALIPYRYCVLDTFRVSHIWAERESDSNSCLRYKVRFEKLTPEAGWWSGPRPAIANELVGSPTPIKPFTQCPGISNMTCGRCKQQSPVVYQIAICLNPNCLLFWNIGVLSSDDLVFNERTKTSYQLHHIAQSFDVKPPMIQSKDFYSGNDVSRIFWRGFCCPQCGKLNSRIKWAGWECSNCFFLSGDARRVYRIAELRDPFRPVYTGPPMSFDWLNPLSKVKMSFLESRQTFRIARYDLGQEIGSVYHILAADKENAVADQLLVDYQSQNIDFRRRYFKTKMEGHFLSQQFTHNAGAQYKYHVLTGTESFDSCAPVIKDALKLIADRVQLVSVAQDFNEILSVAYFEGQKMDYHDDGEKGVAPVVASVSLGTTASMKFRPKRGREHLFFDSPEAEVPGTTNKNILPNEDEDLDARSTIENDNDTGLRKSYGRDILRLQLEHGDVMIMQGHNFQKHVEHAVFPKGLRIAATARFISD